MKKSTTIVGLALTMLAVYAILNLVSLKRDLADAMDSRCYRGAKGRTRYKKMKMRFVDVLMLVLMTVAFFLVLVVNYNWFPGIIDFEAIRWLV